MKKNIVKTVITAAVAAGIFAGAFLIFFAYIGFDALATAAEECKKPGSGSVYARFCNAFNNTVGNFSKSAFAMIKKFYNEYWNDLLNSIPE